MKLYMEEYKIDVMQNKSKSRYRPGDTVYVNDDLTKRVREIQKNIIYKGETSTGRQVKTGL